MRLLQQSPAWAQHAYLRFSGRDYESENCVSNVALGQTLPIIVDDSYVIPECVSFEYIKNHNGDGPSSTEDQHYLDNMFADHLRSKPVGTFKALTANNGDTKALHSASSPMLVGVLMGHILDLKKMLRKDERRDEHSLLAEIAHEYEVLEQLIKASGIGRSITSSMTLDSNSNTVARKSAHAATLLEMGMADAVLFGHIAEALCHDKLSVIIQEYDLIMTYFGDICQRFFAVSYSTADDDSEGVPKTWKSASDALLANSYLRGEGGNMVKSFITGDHHRFHVVVSPGSGLNIPPTTPASATVAALPPASPAIKTPAKTPSHHLKTNPIVVAHASGKPVTASSGVKAAPTHGSKHSVDIGDMEGVYGTPEGNGGMSPNTKEIHRMSNEFTSPATSSKQTSLGGTNLNQGGEFRSPMDMGERASSEFRSPVNPLTKSTSRQVAANKSAVKGDSSSSSSSSSGLLHVNHAPIYGNADTVLRFTSTILDSPTKFMTHVDINTGMFAYLDVMSYMYPQQGSKAKVSKPIPVTKTATVSTAGLLYMAGVLGCVVKYGVDALRQ